jgi:hypothetical protein
MAPPEQVSIPCADPNSVVARLKSAGFRVWLQKPMISSFFWNRSPSYDGSEQLGGEWEPNIDDMLYCERDGAQVYLYFHKDNDNSTFVIEAFGTNTRHGNDAVLTCVKNILES